MLLGIPRSHLHAILNGTQSTDHASILSLMSVRVPSDIHIGSPDERLQPSRHVVLQGRLEGLTQCLKHRR